MRRRSYQLKKGQHLYFNLVSYKKALSVLVCALTENRNRTAADIKHIFDKRGGNLGSPGSVAFMFDFRTIIAIECGGRDEEALMEMAKKKLTMRDILTQDSINNAIAVHAACGGSTNLLLHIPAIAHAAGLKRPTVEDWQEVNRKVARFVDVLPNGPVNHPTVQLYLAGGVPEIMLHLREMGAVNTGCMTVCGKTWDEILDAWKGSSRREEVRKLLRDADGVDPDGHRVFAIKCCQSLALDKTIGHYGNIPDQQLAAIIKFQQNYIGKIIKAISLAFSAQ